MKRLKNRQISIVSCDDDRYKKEYVRAFLEEDGYTTLEIRYDLENRLKTCCQTSKKILLDNVNPEQAEDCVAAIKNLAQSGDLADVSLILFSTTSLCNLLLLLGPDHSAIKVYNLCYEQLEEKDCRDFKALMRVKRITAHRFKNVVEVSATLLYGEIRSGDVLKNIYGGPEMKTVSRVEFFNGRSCKTEKIDCFNTVGENFTFYLNLKEYVNVNPPTILMKI